MSYPRHHAFICHVEPLLPDYARAPTLRPDNKAKSCRDVTGAIDESGTGGFSDANMFCSLPGCDQTPDRS